MISYNKIRKQLILRVAQQLDYVVMLPRLFLSHHIDNVFLKILSKYHTCTRQCPQQKESISIICFYFTRKESLFQYPPQKTALLSNWLQMGHRSPQKENEIIMMDLDSWRVEFTLSHCGQHIARSGSINKEKGVGCWIDNCLSLSQH